MLTDGDLAVLDVEERWWRYPAVKEATIRAELGLSPTRYYQRLNALIDRPETLAARPLLVHRLHRLRGLQRRTRAAG